MLLAVVVPIFLLLASGYFTVKFKLLEQQQIAHIGAFVIKVALPAMFLHSIAAKDLNEIWSFEFLAIYAGVSLMLFTLAFILMSKHYAYATNQSAILALGAAMSNSALIGTAVLTLLLGSKALTYVSLTVIFESLILIPLVLILASSQGRGDHRLSIIKTTLCNLFKNPLFLAVMLGLACSMWQIKIPHYIDEVLAMLGQTASPLALFAIGGGIVGLSVRYINLQAVYLVVSSNLVMPLLVYLGLNYLTDVSREMVDAGTLIAALPMPSIFAMLGQLHGLNEKVLTPLLISTVVGFMVTAGLIALWWS